MPVRWADEKRMTLARKGSRGLVVDGTEYRWRVAPNDEPGVCMVIELATSPAMRLVSSVDHGVIITPGLVRAAIHDGLSAGWTPDAKGRDFVRRVAEFSRTGGALQQCPACEYLSLSKRGDYDICPVCSWEDSGLDVDDLDRVSGPNGITLRQGRENFRLLGACDSRSVASVLTEKERYRFRRIPR